MNLLSAYNQLAGIAQNFPSIHQSGIGGMWTPDDEKRDGDTLIWRAYSGGYEHEVVSVKFGFRLLENYTCSEGITVRLTKGTEEDVQACLDFYLPKGK
jgi:hypothetical protein